MKTANLFQHKHNQPLTKKSAINISNIQEILINQRERQNHTCRIDETGACYYLVNDTRLTEKEFLQMFSVQPKRIMIHGKNLDGRRIY